MWFLRKLPTVEKVLTDQDPFPSELLYYEPKYSVRSILLSMNRGGETEAELDNDVKRIGRMIASEYKKRYKTEPNSKNSEYKGVKMAYNIYSALDLEWIQEIAKKNTKPNYKKRFISEVCQNVMRVRSIVDSEHPQSEKFTKWGLEYLIVDFFIAPLDAGDYDDILDKLKSYYNSLLVSYDHLMNGTSLEDAIADSEDTEKHDRVWNDFILRCKDWLVKVEKGY